MPIYASDRLLPSEGATGAWWWWLAALLSFATLATRAGEAAISYSSTR
jgi:hypothetical protein